jgi:uncharacterized protein (DUF169 family)
MSNNWQPLAEQMQKVLGLKYEPIGITFWDEVPADIPLFSGEMPEASGDGRTGKVAAGCVFWIKSAEQTFTTLPEDHYNCSVGSVTHGLKTLPEVMGNEDVQGLLECEWVTPEEAMALPVIQERPQAITYGPVSDSAVSPDVVLLRINAQQAMVLQDAFGQLPVVGKPQCHIIPMAKEQGEVVMSTGCSLSRLRTGMSPTEMTCAIPGDRLAETVAKLDARRGANAAVAVYANADLKRFGG